MSAGDNVRLKDLDQKRIVNIDLASEHVRQQALKGLCAQWATQAPFYVVNNGVPQVVVARYRDVKEVYNDRECFTVQPPVKEGYERFDYFNGIQTIAQMDGADHDRVRATFAPSFGPKLMHKIDESINRIIEQMLDTIENSGPDFDCMNDFAKHLIVHILLDGVLGLTAEQQKILLNMHDTLGSISDISAGEAPPVNFITSQKDAIQVISDIVSERRKHRVKMDFISAMLDAQEELGTVNDTEVVGNIFGITTAGLGTTATTTAAMLLNLCRHRDQFNQVLANRKLIPMAVEESLRHHAAGFITFPRFANVDCEIAGLPVFAGMPINVSNQAANLDPMVYPDPTQFNIHRNPRNIMTFGSGSHHCPGNRLARRVMSTVLEKVCDRFPDLHLKDEKFEVTYIGMYGELTPATLPMRIS